MIATYMCSNFGVKRDSPFFIVNVSVEELQCLMTLMLEDI